MSSISFAVLISGCAKGWVKALKDLSDSLPPFCLVLDILSKLILRVEKCGIFWGFLLGRSKMRVILVQFTDNTIFFPRASLNNLQSLKLILLVLGRISGLRINLEKSTLFDINSG